VRRVRAGAAALRAQALALVGRYGGDRIAARWRRLPPRLRGPLLPAVLIALAAGYPLYRNDLFGLPVVGSFPLVGTAVAMLIFTMMALGLNVVVGYAGLLDLGYVAFYAMGAYFVGWFASPIFAGHSAHVGSVGVDPRSPGIHVTVWLLLLGAGIATAIVGVVIGLPTLRLRGDYLAIVTLGFGEIMPQVARNGDDFLGTGVNLTNGAQGINPIDSPGFGSWLHEHLGLPEAFSTAVNRVSLFYWTALALLLATVFCTRRLRDSRLGRAWVAIREDETAAAAMGVPLARSKTWSYAVGAFFGGIAGAFYASFKGGTFPEDFFFNISIFILSMVILGGMGNIWGVIAGGLLLSYLDREGLANIGAWVNSTFGSNIDVPKYEFGIFGIILVIVMLFRPQGLIPNRRRKAELEAGVADEPLSGMRSQ
jgi:branched-chain amino acid transport system permease protein